MNTDHNWSTSALDKNSKPFKQLILQLKCLFGYKPTFLTKYIRSRFCINECSFQTITASGGSTQKKFKDAHPKLFDSPWGLAHLWDQVLDPPLNPFIWTPSINLTKTVCSCPLEGTKSHPQGKIPDPALAHFKSNSHYKKLFVCLQKIIYKQMKITGSCSRLTQETGSSTRWQHFRGARNHRWLHRQYRH